MLVYALFSVLLTQCPAEYDIPLTTPGGLSGTSVAIDGDIAVIGSPLGTGTDWASGMVLVYRLQNGTWIKDAELVANDIDAGDMMGVSVDVSGNRVIAGAWFEDHAGSNSGAAYIFENTGGKWFQVAKLSANDASPEDSFGRRVAIEGNFCVVTSPLDDDNGATSGSAYVYQYDPLDFSWHQFQKIIAKNGSPGDQFGLGLAMKGELLAIGSPWANDGAGQVHIFDQLLGSYTESQTLVNPTGEAMDNFGFGLDISEFWLAVGSYHNADIGFDAGSLSLFARTFDGGWIPQGQIYPEGLSLEGEQFGVSVAIDGSVMLVGHRFGVTEKIISGTASIYDLENGSWSFRTNLKPSKPFHEGEFGWSVAIDGNHAIIGAPWTQPDGCAELFIGTTEDCECLADIDGDEIVNVNDLLIVIGYWGTADTPADINDDGIVDVSDLLIVVGSWGACE